MQLDIYWISLFSSTKMKRISTFLLMILLSLSAVAQKVDSLDNSIISELKSDIDALREENQAIKSENQNLLRRIGAVESSINTILGELSAAETLSNELKQGITENTEAINASNIELGERISDANDSVNAQSKSLKNKTKLGVLLALVVLAISALLSLLLHKKGTSKIEALQAQSDKINEEIVNKFATELSDMQKLSSSISILSSNGVSAESEQDLIKSLADRITFMEMTLFKMDSGIRGHKQLSRSISQMKDNLRASGYEIVDMLGKPYNDGMKAVASFEDDENLEEGARIITKVIKPQINYNGVMIQNAQITVSQNK